MDGTAASPKAYGANIITVSFRGDLEICRLLCASFDRFASDAVVHSLYVPAVDVPLFADLATERRRIATQESLLPRWFWKVPLPSPHWRARLFLPRRNVYLTPLSLPVRGWTAQQIMKIAAALTSECEIVAFLDSDNALVRTLSIDHLTCAGKTRLYCDPHHPDMPEYVRWYEAARRLIGLEQDDPYRPSFVHQLIVWRRRVVEGMTRRIEATTGRNWVAALARTPHFAEYIIYGLYAEQVLGLEAAGLYAESRSLAHSTWGRSLETLADTSAFVDALRPDHVACHIQSTSDIKLEQRKQVYGMLTRRAREQDAVAVT